MTKANLKPYETQVRGFKIHRENEIKKINPTPDQLKQSSAIPPRKVQVVQSLYS